MSLHEFHLLTDENIDVEVLSYLREQGFDVFDIKEELLFGLSDKEILNFAYASNRVVISQDSDFGTLVYRDKEPFIGIIYLRPGHEKQEVHVQTVKYLLSNNPKVEAPFVIVAENNNEYIRFRIRLW